MACVPVANRDNTKNTCPAEVHGQLEGNGSHRKIMAPRPNITGTRFIGSTADISGGQVRGSHQGPEEG
ncbi:hypothetical protein U9M48_028605 [Paspalum notatum var. saurae]|uniref:Uncharacterized protein n=1 Tax=Paspalum notatum var. saurae TaxID=547442 RepID=A0AAQ3TWT7_PASNO